MARSKQVNKPSNLSKRRKEAAAAAKFAQVQDNSNQVLVPGHDGKQYTVTIDRRSRHNVVVSCVDNDGAVCKGMHYSEHTVCYHALAAVITLTIAKKNKISFCANRTRALQLARMGGRVLRLANGQNSAGEQWLVVVSGKRVAKQTAPAKIVQATRREDVLAGPSSHSAVVAALHKAYADQAVHMQRVAD